MEQTKAEINIGSKIINVSYYQYDEFNNIDFDLNKFNRLKSSDYNYNNCLLITKEEEEQLFLHLNYYKWKMCTCDSNIEEYLNNYYIIREMLSYHNYPLIVKLSNDYSQKLSVDIDDLKSEMQFTLLRAIDLFDVKMNNKFSSYLYRAFFLQSSRLECKIGFKDLSLDSGIKYIVEAKNEFNLIDYNDFIDFLIWSIDNNMNLNDREKEILIRRIGLPHNLCQNAEQQTFIEIGRDMGVTRQRIQQIVPKLYDKLHEYLYNDENMLIRK